MNVATHSSVGSGGKYDLQSLKAEHLPGSMWKNGIFASDMDQTLFINDMGALVFIQYLQDPSFYRMSTEDFRSVIMPAGTEWFFEQGIRNEIEGVSANDCLEVVQLSTNITNAFDILRNDMLSRVHPGTELRTRLISFMQTICSLDSMLISLKNQHRNAVQSNELAKAFSRFRLFGGQEKGIIDLLTQQALALLPDHPERVLPIRAGDSKHYEVDRLVRVNQSIYTILQDVVQDGAEGYVVTASPLQIASRAIRSSVYEKLIGQDSILATKLSHSECGQYLSGCVDGEFIAGIGKRQLLEELAISTHKKVILALGDLPGSDAAMGAVALLNNGVFVITHKPNELEEIRKEFGVHLGNIMGRNAFDHAQERVWYVPTLPMNE